ncbi:hypothetical protein [Oceanococcus atlanticus]|uniref:hypothetical protein n=1 Tax=Oceanococcus atlanticus TaxID=1317117 RepID=UPI0011BA5B25|nr:hypothetical protein [Oceanococcus atlanticus]
MRFALCLRKAPAFLMALAIGACSGGQSINSDARGSDRTSSNPAQLNSVDEVLNAVATTLRFSEPYYRESAPSRPSWGGGSAEGEYRENCERSGEIVYDESAKRTDYIECLQTFVDGYSDHLSDGVISETCFNESQADVGRCLNYEAMRWQIHNDDSFLPEEQTLTYDLDGQLLIDETNFGHRLLVHISKRDMVEFRGETKTWEFDAEGLEVEITYESALQASQMHIDGYLETTSPENSECADGQLGVKTPAPLEDMRTTGVPQSGRLELSSAGSEPVTVTFSNDGTLSFALDGEEHFFQTAELNERCGYRVQN